MQYSLKSMMIFFFVIALLCAFSFALPRFISYIILCTLLLMVPACLVTGIVFGSGDQKAFSIGASATFITMIWTNGPLKNLLSFSLAGYSNLSRTNTTLTVVLTFLTIGCAGAVAVVTRRRLAARHSEPPLPPPTSPPKA